MLAALIDSISASASVKAVRRIRAVSGEISRAFASSSVPVIPGIRWSLMMAATGLAGEEVEGRLAVLGAEHAILHRQQRLERVEHPRLVVDEQDGVALGAHAARRPRARGCAR